MNILSRTQYRVKNVFFAPVFAALLLISGPVLAATGEPATLTFLTWGDYIDEDVVAEFEAEYNAQVKFAYYESDAARDEMLTTSNAEGFDLIMVDSVTKSFHHQLGWVTEFDTQQAPNITQARLPELSGLEARDDLCTPYAWGTTGIAYRTDLVSEPITRWQQLYQPAPELEGRILMSDMEEEIIGMALKSLGYSMNSDDPQQLEQVRQLLLAQAPAVAGYSAVAVETEKSKLVSGEVSAILTYSGDALMLREVEPRIKYVLPEEGGVVWADFICLAAKASNPELAHHFVDFLNRPAQAAKNALYINNATPNQAAQALLPASFLNDPLVYPDQAILAKSETHQILSPRLIKRHKRIMRDITRAHH
ncbi:spermidine/putrescine ABC transporter substrate-binding protein [Oceanisphaera marina]|uniref:Spermidine/putrescine ABC transporter substrate-binding protein n=1 Tax=Oceanisphaera marina TaxID=2017550 RepID=A0ABQ1INR6_9GAMM|nr:spermidine/putrescine ABC transporter substrate-binding protein [Oceanisphaera marina]GGB48598.1 spermidine/putrescine ABC transporter substrate-binding protein [Oceanisphaera marina]